MRRRLRPVWPCACFPFSRLPAEWVTRTTQQQNAIRPGIGDDNGAKGGWPEAVRGFSIPVRAVLAPSWAESLWKKTPKKALQRRRLGVHFPLDRDGEIKSSAFSLQMRTTRATQQENNRK
jgi:hypothetical protein